MSAICTPKTARLIPAAALFLVLLAAPAFSAPDPVGSHALFFQANEDYRKGDYEAAAGKYETLIRKGEAGALVFFNLGNSFLRMDDPGRAILNYERARILAPRDKDVDYNLRYARGKTVDKAEYRSDFSWLGWVREFSAVEAFWAFAVVNLLFFASLGLRILVRREWTYYLTASLLAAWLMTGISAGAWYGLARSDRRAVVLSPEVTARSGPSEKETALFTLHAGTVAEVERRENGWRLVRFSSDKRGWVPAGDVETIRPLYPD